MKTRKVYLKQVEVDDLSGLGDTVRYRVTKTVDAGTEFNIGQVLDGCEVDTLAKKVKYTVTVV